MQKNNLKFIIIVLLTIVCAIMFIGARYVMKLTTLNTFKFLSENVEMMNNTQNSAFEEVKATLKTKYKTEFVEFLNTSKTELKNKFSALLGEKYTALTEEFCGLDIIIDAKTQEFYNSSEYLSAKNELINAKSALDSASDSEKDACITRVSNAVSKLGTLNVKLNNVIKSYKERSLEIKSEIKRILVENKIALFVLRNEEMNKVKLKIDDIIKRYNLELSELKANFGVLGTKALEFPFESDMVLGVCVTGRVETEFFNENLDYTYETQPIASETGENFVS